MKAFFSIFMCFTILFTLFTVNAQSATTITDIKSGTQDGYYYDLWKDQGTTSMTLNSGGAFSCQWTNVGDALFRKGKKFDATKTYQEIGNISVNYDCSFQPNGNAYLAVYGLASQYVEYYIVENWGVWKPPGAISKGTINVDGGTYDIYETTVQHGESVLPIDPVYQYWSVRTSKRTSGTVSVNEHFKAWESNGMKMGNLKEVSLLVEGYQSSGNANVTDMSISISSPTTPPVGIKYGDVNGDGKINSTDLSNMKRYVLEIGTLTNKNAGDLNGDGLVNSTDVSILKRYILGIVVSLPLNGTQTPTPSQL